MDNAERRAFLASTTRTARAVGIVLYVVRQSIVDNVRQVVDVQSACCHICGHQQLNGMLAELLHGQVALLLREVAVQRLCIVTIAYQLVGHFLCLQLCATEDDGEDARIVVHQSFQRQVFVLGVYHIVDMVYVLSPFVARTHHNLLVVVQIALGNALYLLAHGGREEQGVAVFRYTLEYRVNALLEAHVQHLVSLVEHHIMHVVQLGYTTLHQVDESSWCRHNDLYAFPQSTNLLFDAGSTIDGLNMDAVHVFGEVAHVVGNLQTEFTGRSKDEGMGKSSTNLAQLGTGLGGNPLQYGNAECCRLACTRLGQRNDVVKITQQVGNHLFLHGHGLYEAHLFYGFTNLFADTKFFKCFQ